MAYPDPPVTPPVPQRGDRATFSNRVDAFLTWVAAIIPWMQGFVLDFMDKLSTLAAGGANSFGYKFDAAITDADPGAGFLRLGSAVQNTSTVMRIDTQALNGSDMSAAISALLSSTSSTKGSVRLQKLNDPSAWLLFDILGSTAATGYFNLVLSYKAGSSASPFSAGNTVLVFMDRNGDRGDNGSVSYAKFSDRKAPGVSGGAATGGLNDRTLNTTDSNDIAGASLSSNQVTLPAGSYDVTAFTPVFGPIGVRAVLFNVTDNAVSIYGASGYTVKAADGSGTQVNCQLNGKITITSPKVFKLQTFAQVAVAANTALGYGATQSGVMECYSELIFRKIG